ncbi:D-isomer specific 2-hydroxyacid dehydrogenase family protein [Salinibacterium sp. ZJ450]|uniref:D-isomer specific 2-hydroxyacid dehydrogenase family protein n=1 Tax=Salinibacterium sp. ZJ450 TaxID=2708338 RepID=UPI0014234C56|nr:D-isomer specific 2-hydroxyacid dehydrogenase family protein [Salinibacterium sp. ZJ450]
MTAAARQSGEHRDLDGSDAAPRLTARPTPGPIAVLPEPEPFFVNAARAAGATVAPLDADTRGLIWLSPDGSGALRAVLAEHPRLEWVQLPWAGVDAFADLLQHTESTLPLITSGKGTYSEPVAEQALALTLSTLRFIPAKARASAWEQESRGTSLYGRHVVIIGAGGIARELIRLLAPFQTTITVVRRSATPIDGAARTVTVDELNSVLPHADVLVVAAALSATSAHLIGRRQLALMRPRAVLVNIARGGIVDTDALVDALERGVIAGAGLDVTDPEPLPAGHPLWNAPNSVVTMHSADTPEMTRPLLAERVRHNVRAFLGDGRFRGIVDPRAGY